MSEAARTLSHLVRCPGAPVALLSAALATVDLAVVQEYSYEAALARAVASHPSAAPSDLVRLAGCRVAAGDVAKNPAAPVGALLELLSTRDDALVRLVLGRPEWPVEVVSWARSRISRTGPLSHLVLRCVLESGSAPGDLVEAAVRAGVVHPSRFDDDVDSDRSLAGALVWRMRSDVVRQDGWALGLDDVDLLRALFAARDVSPAGRRRCWDVSVAAVQVVADEVFWRSSARDVLPPLVPDLVPVLRAVLQDGDGPLGVFRSVVLELLRSHDFSGVPYREYFVSVLERSVETSEAELLSAARSGDLGVLEGLVSRQSLPTAVGLEVVASRVVPTELALRLTSSHLRHDLTERALEVRWWDRAFVVATLAARPGALARFPLDPELGLEVLEALARRSAGSSDARLVADHLDVVPVERWADLSWSTVRFALPNSPALASRVLALLSEELPDGGWEVFARLLSETVEYPGTFRGLAASLAALSG